MTPGIASARLASMFLTRACGIGLSKSLANTMPSARKSSAYLARPVIFAWRSGGEMSTPISLSAMVPPTRCARARQPASRT
jgi:hypothetical protein